MAESKETLVHWLRDAHAMETANVDHLKLQLGRVKDYPKLEQRVRQHLEESRGQVERIDQCLERCGSGASVTKQAVTKLAGYAEALGAMLTRDEVVKQAIGSYAYEHFEIGNYRALIAAAEHCGEKQVASLLQQNLRQEEAMASWLEQNMPQLTQDFLAHATQGARAGA